jgi:O-antigen ligase
MPEVLLRRLQGWLVTGSKTQQIVGTIILCLIVGGASGALFVLLGPLFAVAFVAAAAVGLAMLRSTQLTLFALVGLICLLPFASLPVPDIGFSPTLLDVVLAVLLITWLFRVARKKQTRFVSSPVGLPILAFMLLACASFVVGLSFGSLTTNLLRRFAELLLNLFLFFLVINNVRGQEQLEQIITVLILAGFAASLIGIVLNFLPQELTIRLLSVLRILRYPSGSDVLRFVEDNPELPLRATSTSVDPNVFGGLLVIVAAITIPQLLARNPLPLFSNWWRRQGAGHASVGRGINWLVVPILATMVVCLLLTYSRSALLGLATAFGVVAVLRYRKLLVLALLIGVLVLLLPQTRWYVQHLIEGLRGEDLATQMRFGEYKDAIILVSRYPLLGVGFAEAPDIDTYIGVSMLYLLIAEEMGLVGLGVFLLIMALGIAQMLKRLKTLAGNPRLEAILLGLLAAIVGALVSGLFDHYFFNVNFQHAVALFWLCLGLGISAVLLPIRRAHQAADAAPGQDGVPVLGYPVL